LNKIEWQKVKTLKGALERNQRENSETLPQEGIASELPRPDELSAAVFQKQSIGFNQTSFQLKLMFKKC